MSSSCFSSCPSYALVFLPATFGARFQPHLTKIIPPILSGLSDSEDYVREAAMRAGRMIVTNYSSKAIDLLLPELERGMFDSGWRIRVSPHFLLMNDLTDISHSNPPLRWSESFCSRCQESAERPRSRRTKRRKRLRWRSRPARRLSKFSVSSAATAFLLPFTWPARMLSTLFVNRLCISGRRWCTIHQELVRYSH